MERPGIATAFSGQLLSTDFWCEIGLVANMAYRGLAGAFGVLTVLSLQNIQASPSFSKFLSYSILFPSLSTPKFSSPFSLANPFLLTNFSTLPSLFHLDGIPSSLHPLLPGLFLFSWCRTSFLFPASHPFLSIYGFSLSLLLCCTLSPQIRILCSLARGFIDVVSCLAFFSCFPH